MHSHDNLTYTARSRFRDNLSMKAFGERTVSNQPLSHIVGQMSDLFVPICIGATVYFIENTSGSSLIEKLWFTKPTYFFWVPYIWTQIKQSYEKDTNIEGLELCRNAFVLGSSVSNSLIQFFRDKNINLCQEYGTCEINFHIFSKFPRDPIDSIGNINDHKSTSVGPESDLVAHGRSIFMGYMNNEAQNKESFDNQNLFHVPDKVSIDNNGNLFIYGRLTELIKTSAGVS